MCALVLTLIEMLGPFVAETRKGGTPWHAHHIAERYSLLVIIALGEVITGTATALGAVVEHSGWSWPTVGVGLAGVGLALGMWWIYFTMPMGEMLLARLDRAFAWGYGHLLVFPAIAAVGAGLHVAAAALEGASHLSAVGTVCALLVPVAVYVLAFYGIYYLLGGRHYRLHTAQLTGVLIALAAAVALAAGGAPIPVCLLVIALAPAAVVVGYEVLGYRHIARMGEEGEQA